MQAGGCLPHKGRWRAAHDLVQTRCALLFLGLHILQWPHSSFRAPFPVELPLKRQSPGEAEGGLRPRRGLTLCRPFAPPEQAAAGPPGAVPQAPPAGGLRGRRPLPSQAVAGGADPAALGQRPGQGQEEEQSGLPGDGGDEGCRVRGGPSAGRRRQEDRAQPAAAPRLHARGPVSPGAAVTARAPDSRRPGRDRELPG